MTKDIRYIFTCDRCKATRVCDSPNEMCAIGNDAAIPLGWAKLTFLTPAISAQCGDPKSAAASQRQPDLCDSCAAAFQDFWKRK